MRIPLVIASSVLALATAVPSARSQVVISEIEFVSRNSEGQWIEIVNLGQQEEDIAGWSIYLATQTPNAVQNYWWGFPAGTKIGAGKFLRIHWLEPIQQSTATDIWTGDKVVHFLFGLFAEKLDRNRGALALFNTQANNQMNDREKIQDWVSWGTTGFKRETLAVQNNRWKSGTFAPAATPDQGKDPTLAYDYSKPLGVHEGSFWFRDFTPTPGADNLGGAFAVLYGTACKGSLNNLAGQEINGLPVNGNRDFYLGIDRPLASEEFALALLGLRGDGTFSIFGCPYWLSLQLPAIALIVPKSGNFARLQFGALDPTLLAGLQIGVQWAVFVPKPAELLGFTQGAEIKFGQ